MAEQEQTTTEATQEPGKATPPAVATQTETPAEPTVPYARFKEINDKLKALEETATKQAKAQAEADEKRLQEQAQWQELAQKRQAKVEELSAQADLADKLTQLVTEQYQAEIKEWPESVRAMAPSDEASILTKLEWMQKAKPLALELAKDKTPVAGNGRKPTPTGASGSQAKTKIEPIYDVRRNF